MRKFNIITFSNIIFLIFWISVNAQDTGLNKKSSSYQMKPNTKEVQADFLSSYYAQDGNNSAVTGGKGTEKLTDIANVFIINIPLDSINSLGFYGGADFYSSASTDNIDTQVSSASSSDTRIFGTISYQRKNLKSGTNYGLRFGFSTEYDYNSLSGGISYSKEWNEGNSELNFTGQAFFDKWLLIYPRELRRSVSLASADRHSYNAQINYSQVINKRMQVGLSIEAVKMTGLLSTPFHRVYFSDSNSHDIERFPDNRFKIPLGIRLNYYPIDYLVIRSYYRYYWDNFGITGNTLELETPIKIGSFWVLAPFYRYHTQISADYFAPYATHLSTETFYTSDYDLSAFDSHKIGVGIRYSPLYGLVRFKPIKTFDRILMIKYLESRFARYYRSTGLNAFIASINIVMSYK